MDITRDEIIADITGPGKFEGCTVPDRLAWELTMYGDGETLSDGFGGTSYTRLDAPIFVDKDCLTDEEREEYGAYAGVILTETSDGFVSAEWFETKNKLETVWEAISLYFTDESDEGEFPD